MKYLIVFVCSLLSSMAFSSANALSSKNITAGVMQATQGKSAFETLLEAHRLATHPAQISDFEGSSKTCVAVMATAPDDVMETAIAIHCGNILVPAKPPQDIPAVPPQDLPAEGPLLPARHIPGVPARHIPGQDQVCAKESEILLMGTDALIKNISDKNLSVFSNELTSSDFVIRVAKNNQGIYSDAGDGAEISIRRNSNYFPFILTNAGGLVLSGYCY